MKGRRLSLAFGLAAAAAIAEAPQARAQCRLCETPGADASAAAIDAPIELQVEGELDFDRLVVIGLGEGSATIRPDGSRQVTGSVEAISGRAMVGEARVHGEAGRAVRIELPRAIQMHSISGGQITVDEIISDLPAAPRLDSAGNLSFRFGGRIRVDGNVDGDFRGQLPITVEYL
jgi:hypothetical protein